MTAQIAKSRLFECLEKDKIQRAVNEVKDLQGRSTGPESPKKGTLIDFPRSNSRIASTATFERAMTLSAVFPSPDKASTPDLSTFWSRTTLQEG